MLLLYAERAAHGVLALLGLYGLAGLVIAPTLAYLQEKPNFKRLNTVRCVAVMATWILISMVCSVLLLPALLVAPQWTQLAAHRLARGCSSVLLVVLSGSWECDVVGREHLPPDRPVVIAANHSSMVDVAMVYQLQCVFFSLRFCFCCCAPQCPSHRRNAAQVQGGVGRQVLRVPHPGRGDARVDGGVRELQARQQGVGGRHVRDCAAAAAAAAAATLLLRPRADDACLATTATTTTILL